MTKDLKQIRKTIVVVFSAADTDSVPVVSRVMQWEAASKSNARLAHRVEYAGPTPDNDGSAYLIDLELECKGANRNDFTKFVRTYLPEAQAHYITE